jgi:hypothetical protein
MFVVNRTLPSPEPTAPSMDLPTFPTTVIGFEVLIEPILVEALTCADN